MTRLQIAANIVARCRREGLDARKAGKPYQDCPYREHQQELEYAAWMDGWTRAEEIEEELKGGDGDDDDCGTLTDA